jgi:hypothetical protein
MILGVFAVFGTVWARNNLDRTDLAGSLRAAVRQLAPAELGRRVREAWQSVAVTEA